jgi:hypothetical protein
VKALDRREEMVQGTTMRPPNDAKARLLETAMTLTAAHGSTTVGVHELCQQVIVSRKAVFSTFSRPNGR